MAEEKAEKPNVATLYTKVFQKCEGDISQTDKVKHFDKLRKLNVKHELLRLEKDKDSPKYHPTKFHYKAQRAMQAIQQQLGFYVGNETNPGEYDHLEPKKQIEMYTTAGISAMDDLINPEED